VECSLWREDGSVIYSYSCFWTLPVESLSSRIPAELTTIFYCIIWDSPHLEGQVPYSYPLGTGWPSYNPGHWVPFSSPLTTRRVTVEVFQLTSTPVPRQTKLVFGFLFILRHRGILVGCAFYAVYDCAGEANSNCKLLTLFKSERAPHINKPATVWQ
jgi:hypothetical protein